MAHRRQKSPKESVESVEKPLTGKIFFLDLSGFRSVRSLQSKLLSLGGRVEPFLSKEVCCVITNRNDGRASPAGSSRDKSAVLTSQRSRGQAMVKRAQQSASQKSNGKMDILETASALGVQIKHVKVVLQWIDDFKSQHLLSKPSSPRSPDVAIRNITARQLRGRCYKPVVHHFTTCPRIDFSTDVGTCPFDTAPAMQTRAAAQRKYTRAAASTAATRKTLLPQMNTKAKTWIKGFCELCNVGYDNIRSHIRTIQHQQFVDNRENYTRLDRYLSKGPDLEVFQTKKGKKSPDAQNKKKSTPVKTHERAKTSTARRRRASERTPGPIKRSPTPTPVKKKRAQKSELRKRLKQVQQRLSFSGFDEDPIKSKILTSPRKRRPLEVSSPASPLSSPLQTTPRKRKLELSGSYTEIAPPSKQSVKSRKQKRKGSTKDESMSKRKRKSSNVMKDLMTRLDDAKASRPDTSPSEASTQSKRQAKRKRPRPRRTCAMTYQRRRAGNGPVGPTIQQVARKLKKELAVTTPVICTMDLRNGKMKVSQS